MRISNAATGRHKMTFAILVLCTVAGHTIARAIGVNLFA